MSDVELKPCPFCGGEAKVYETNIGMDCSCWWNVECTVCEAAMEGFGSERIAIRTWNTRHERMCRYKHIEGALHISECGMRRYFVDVPLPIYCSNCGGKVIY